MPRQISRKAVPARAGSDAGLLADWLKRQLNGS
jgi:hypothetical protein